MRRKILYRKVLNENDRLAASLRQRYLDAGVLCLNLISSPGAGKTALLERTLEVLPDDSRVAVLTGDIETENDARRLARFGYPVKQISTGGACHLDARMIERHLDGWNLDELDLLLVENVGNLVCPTSFDLGEDEKIVVLSVTEGDDKPSKYPGIFHRARLLVLNKIDLVPYVPFDPAAARENARRVHPDIEILETSCTTGEGIDRWVDWIRARLDERSRRVAVPVDGEPAPSQGGHPLPGGRT
jgi:hydrogenase nickel incorporation protein HypB